MHEKCTLQRIYKLLWYAAVKRAPWKALIERKGKYMRFYIIIIIFIDSRYQQFA